jgi:uncharacterized protein YjbJ (UPF0337 family)
VGSTGPQSGAKSVAEDLKGKGKEAAGALLDDEQMKAEGQAQQEKADAQRETAVKEAEAEKARAKEQAREAQQRAHQR